jgi:glucose-1-phosphate adenylyltransferase
VFFFLQNTMIIGADYYESEEQREKVLKDGGVPLGVGAGTVIKNCIVDKNARIGRNVKIVNEKGVKVSTGGLGGWVVWKRGCYGSGPWAWVLPP